MNGKYLLKRGYKCLNTVSKLNDFFGEIDLAGLTVKNIGIYVPEIKWVLQQMYVEGEQLDRFIWRYKRLRIEPRQSCVLVIEFHEKCYLCIDLANVISAKYSRNLSFEYHVMDLYPSNRYIDVLDCLNGSKITKLWMTSQWEMTPGYDGHNEQKGFYIDFEYDDPDGPDEDGITYKYTDTIALMTNRYIDYYTNRAL